LKISVSDNFFDRIRVVSYQIRTVSFNNKVFVSILVIPFDETQLEQENCSMTEHHLNSGSWILRYGLIYYLYSWEAMAFYRAKCVSTKNKTLIPLFSVRLWEETCFGKVIDFINVRLYPLWHHNEQSWNTIQIYHVWEGYLRSIPVERRKISRAE
jgi:hypothetical protein